MFVEYYFIDKAKRDSRLRQLHALGETHLKARTTCRAVLDPMAVVDAFDDGRSRFDYSPNGFGGLADKWWPVLYTIVSF